MKCRILHESRGRMRVRMQQRRMTAAQADKLQYYLAALPEVAKVTVSERTMDATILYKLPAERGSRGEEEAGPGAAARKPAGAGDASSPRGAVIAALSAFSYEETPVEVPEHTGRRLSREYEDRLFFLILDRAVRTFLLPSPVQKAVIVAKAAKYVLEGLRCLRQGRLEVPVLDATTITVSLLRSDFSTAGSVMFLLDAGALLEEWTHKKSVDDLARRMYLGVDKAWVRVGAGTRADQPAGGVSHPAGEAGDPGDAKAALQGEEAQRPQEVLMDVRDIRPGDHVVVRTGNVIPLDGVVRAGEGNVNQASMTGESLPVRKSAGAYVYAGTVLEEGELEICVEKALGSGRYDKIVHMIEDSEKLKSATESRAVHLADSLVPWSLGGTALAYLLTRNVTRALSFLMVDFSCALKLAMPISVLSAMRECSDHHINVKGGKFLEAVSQADTIVFDKTGTLTYATPSVRRIITFGGRDEAEMLRLAACLEEHFPHSIANAVVREAARRGITHAERHAQVEYVVAHGIASSIDGERALIGSYHFIFEDEKCTLPDGSAPQSAGADRRQTEKTGPDGGDGNAAAGDAGHGPVEALPCTDAQGPDAGSDRARFDALPDDCSLLYLALGGKLAAVLCIEDPIREEAARAIADLHRAGFSRIVMMTGDSHRTAAAVASRLGMDEFFAEVLPEDKAAFVRREHEAGRKVVMIGDGINDSPALSEADAGIAIAAGAAIAREIADITISAEDLGELVVLRRISNGLMDRIDTNYRRIMAFNGGLIALGFFGVLMPASAALLHNISTIYFSVDSMQDLL